MAALAPAPPVPQLRCYALEAKHEFLRLLRSPAFALPTLAFPPMFYWLFAVLLNRGDADAVRYLFATYGVFGVMAPGLFGLGVSVAADRERGWLTFLRALPMPPGAYVAAKMATAMSFAALVYAALAAIAFALGGVRLAPSAWVLLAATAVLGVLPFCALGLLIGSRVGPAAAPAVVNVLYLPMAFLSGLWVPLSALPDVVQRLAPAWPAYHLAQLALAAAGRAHDGSLVAHAGVLLVFTAACSALAWRTLARRA